MESRRLTITVVDDDPSVRKALSRLLNAAGHDVKTFASAEELLESNASLQSDCLILDVHLPGMSGLQLQAEMSQSTCAVPIVFISAFTDENARTQAIEAGAIEFLPKPLENDRLLSAIDRAVDGGTTKTVG